MGPKIMSAPKEIIAICTGPGAPPHPVRIPNPEGKRFDEINLSNYQCPVCGKIGTMSAMPV